METWLSVVLLCCLLPQLCACTSECPTTNGEPVLCALCSDTHAAVRWNASSSMVSLARINYQCVDTDGNEIPVSNSCYGGKEIGFGNNVQNVLDAGDFSRIHVIDTNFSAGVVCTFYGHYVDDTHFPFPPTNCTIKNPTECAQDPCSCLLPATCVNSDGECQCQCVSGYQDDTCRDTVQCKKGLSCTDKSSCSVYTTFVPSPVYPYTKTGTSDDGIRIVLAVAGSLLTVISVVIIIVLIITFKLRRTTVTHQAFIDKVDMSYEPVTINDEYIFPDSPCTVLDTLEWFDGSSLMCDFESMSSLQVDQSSSTETPVHHYDCNKEVGHSPATPQYVETRQQTDYIDTDITEDSLAPKNETGLTTAVILEGDGSMDESTDNANKAAEELGTEHSPYLKEIGRSSQEVDMHGAVVHDYIVTDLTDSGLRLLSEDSGLSMAMITYDDEPRENEELDGKTSDMVFTSQAEKEYNHVYSADKHIKSPIDDGDSLLNGSIVSDIDLVLDFDREFMGSTITPRVGRQSSPYYIATGNSTAPDNPHNHQGCVNTLEPT